MLRRVALVRTDVSEELSVSIRVTRIGELGTKLAVTSNRRTLLHGGLYWESQKGRGMPSSEMSRRVALVRTDFPKFRLLQEPHNVTSQKTAFFIVAAVKSPNLTRRKETTRKTKTWGPVTGSCEHGNEP
jgi:hypothetical protein